MYIPKSYIVNDKNEAIEFMKRFSFGTIITSKDNKPMASHLPFLVDLSNDKIVLKSHFAKANNQWEDIEGYTLLVIFSEPHAYISPSNYEKELNVPTWNYISVHAYGKGRLINEGKEVMDLLENTITNYEASYKEQWDTLPNDYKIKMAKGIVAFEIEISDLQAKKKLSQNKTEKERRNIVDALSNSQTLNERMIADYMMRDLGK